MFEGLILVASLCTIEILLSEKHALYGVVFAFGTGFLSASFDPIFLCFIPALLSLQCFYLELRQRWRLRLTRDAHDYLEIRQSQVAQESRRTQMRIGSIVKA